ncbi:MAG TPA: alpha/beta fold hydrolase [Planctomycetota bacterium]|nr:alpha/beta fold hydrolase [Planctomycetota bacterium]
MTRLVLLPGMGATARMYGPLARRLDRALSIPPWRAPGGTLADYARRHVAAGDVRAGDIVGGSSFGGFVALEIARQVDCAGVVLIGSARSTRSYRRLAALAPLTRLLPRVRPMPAPVMRLIGSVLGSLPAVPQRDVFVAMARSVPPDFLHWACDAAAHWTGVERPRCPVLQIHGAADRVIPLAEVSADVVIARAGHIPALTRPGAVAAAMAAWIERVG